ncbi:MAG TPA: ribonuclease J [Candidatus Saccharimonadales bacterium]|nr:ribonuclease J [Candidatus Saccharimonadales bacterium]
MDEPNTNQQQGQRSFQPRQNNGGGNGNGRPPRSQNQNGGRNGQHQQGRNGQPGKPQNQNSVLARTQTRRGEVFAATRRKSETVNTMASQHIINIPVNKTAFNGYHGAQYTLNGARKANRLPLSDEPTVKVMPIGGLGEMGIGKNMMAIEYGNDIIVIDMGLLFPGDGYPGINYIVPDISYLEERKHKIRGVVFTHAHLDHIGAFKHLIHKIPAPVYASHFTVGMLQKTMDEATSGYTPQYNTLNPDTHERVQLGEHFSVELVRVNHSIPDATAVVIRTPAGVLIDTGDWRFEEQPVDGKKFDLARLEQIANEEGILMLMNESTNCEFEGTHMHGEYDIAQSFDDIMQQNQSARIIISTFSSQIHRIQMILEKASKNGRKVAFAGYSMIQNMEVALRSNAIKVPKDVIMRMDDIVKLPDNKVTIVCTGSQGELTAVLNRMATGAHKHIKVKSSDIIVFSSNPIPGNEVNVVHTVDGLMREGAEVLQNRTKHLHDCGPLHMSGHAYYDDHVKLISTLKPKYYMPIHGEFHMLVHNAELAEKSCNIPKDNIFVCDSGDVVELNRIGAAKTGRVPVGGVMYDNSGEEVSEVVLKDRLHIASEGMFIVLLTVSKKTGRLLTSPDIISRGFIYLRDSEELMNTIRAYLKQKVARSFGGRRVELDEVKREIKDDVSHILYDQTHRTPIVIPVINEISGEGQQSNNNGGGGGGQRRPQPQRPQQPQSQPRPQVQPPVPTGDSPELSEQNSRYTPSNRQF